MIGKLENQFRQELDRFKDEMVGHKNDFARVVQQLKQDAQKTIELRKSAEERALNAERDNEK